MSFLKKASIFFLIFVLLTVFVLPGCRVKDGPEEVDSYDGIELTYYKVFDDSEVMEPIINEFLGTHPGLKINYRKFSDFDEYVKTILNEMSEGEGPDIFSMQNTWFASNFRKLAPMPEKYGKISDFEETFVDVARRDLVRVDDNGLEQIYGVPMTVDTLALFYNKDHFEDRIPTRGRPSETWEGIKEDIALLTKQDNSFERFEVAGMAMGRADNISRAVDILYLLFLQYGVSFYNDNISEAIFAGRQGSTVSYPGVEALKFYTSFADAAQKYYTWNEFIADDDLGQEVQAFARGKVSMMMGYSFNYDDIMNEIEVLDAKGETTIDPDAIRVASAPQIYDPKVSTEKRVTYASYFAETVSRNSEHQDIAWEFLIFLTSRKNLEYYFDKLHKPTSRRDMIDEQKKDPKYGVFASQIGYSESFPILDYYRFKEIFSEVITKAVEGEASRADLVDAQDLINTMLPEEGYVNPKADEEEAAQIRNENATDEEEGDSDPDMEVEN